MSKLEGLYVPKSGFELASETMKSGSEGKIKVLDILLFKDSS